MRPARTMNLLGALLIGGVLLLSRRAVAAEKAAELSSECVSTEAESQLSVCPKGPTHFDIKKKRAVAFKSAPSPREMKQREEVSKPRDATILQQFAERDTRKTRLKARARALLMSEIKGLERLLRETRRKSPDRPQLVRRLAEDYVELESAAVRDQSAAEVIVGSKKATPMQRASERHTAAQSKRIAEAARQDAIRYYKMMEDEYPDYSKLDEVLYYLAYEYEQAKDFQNARKVYYDLIEKAPQSPYIPHAYLAFGELFFQEAQGDPSKFDLAAAAYKEVLKFPPPKNKLYGYARYKLGYVYWNKGQYPEALNEFKAVIEYGEQYSELPSATQLAKSARRDMIPVYAVSGNPTHAYGFFKPLSGDVGDSDGKTLDILDELGYAYLDTGHYADGIALYRDLMSRDRGDRFCHYQTQVTTAVSASKSSDKEAIVKELDKQLDVRKAFLADNHSDKSKLECSNRTAELVSETAMSWHLEAVGSGGVRGTGDKKTMELAAYLYRKITENFKSEDFAQFTFPRIVKDDWPTFYKIKYAMADLLYFQQRWEDCGPAFDAVVDEDPTNSDAAEAAYAAVLCYQKMYDQKFANHADRKTKGLGSQGAGEEDTKAQKGQWEKLKPKEFTPLQKGMLEAFNRYACYVKPDANDKEAMDQYIDVKFARARTYFESQHWEEAAVAFRDIALNYPNSDAGIYAGQLYLEAVNVLGSRAEPPRPACFTDMANDVPQFLKLYCEAKKLDDNKDQCELLTRIEFDIMRLKAQKTVELADQMAAQGKGGDAIDDYRKAADAYGELWSKYCEEALSKGEKVKQCEKADEILYNRAKAYQAGRLLAKSIGVRMVLLDPKYGLSKSPLAYKAMYEIGANYQAIAVYDKASDWFEKYAEETGYKGEKADQALSDSVALRLGLGMEEEAIKDAKNFNRYFGGRKPAEAAQIAFSVAAHFGEKQDWEDVVKRLVQSMGIIDHQATLDVRVQAHSLLGRAYANTKREANAAREYRVVLATWRDPQKAVQTIQSIPGDSDDVRTRRIGRSLESVGEATFYFAERMRDKADAVKFPEYRGKGDLAAVKQHIDTKVKAWIDKKRPLIEAATTEYKKIVDLQPVPPPRWVIAAGSRVGQMWGEFVKEFRAAPIPDSIRKDYELRTAYYGALDDASEPQKQMARGAFETCLKYSVKYQYSDQFSRTCEEWLANNFKNEYHLIDEFRDAPNRVNSALRDKPRPVRIGGSPYVPPNLQPDVVKQAVQDAKAQSAVSSKAEEFHKATHSAP